MNIFHSIRWKLTSAILLVVFAAIGLLGLYLSQWADDNYVSSLRMSLERESRMDRATHTHEAESSRAGRCAMRAGK